MVISLKIKKKLGKNNQQEKKYFISSFNLAVVIFNTTFELELCDYKSCSYRFPVLFVQV